MQTHRLLAELTAFKLSVQNVQNILVAFIVLLICILCVKLLFYVKALLC